MKFILISDKNGVVGKNVYAGDDVKSQIVLDSLAEKTGLTYTETDQTTFDASVIPSALTKDRTDWQAAKKSTDTALAYLANKLGLE